MRAKKTTAGRLNKIPKRKTRKGGPGQMWKGRRIKWWDDRYNLKLDFAKQKLKTQLERAVWENRKAEIKGRWKLYEGEFIEPGWREQVAEEFGTDVNEVKRIEGRVLEKWKKFGRKRK